MLSPLDKVALAEIRCEQGMLRADLAGRLGISKSKAERIVGSLLKKGYLVERSEKNSRRGRGGIPLEIRPGKFEVLAVDLGASSVRAARIDWNGAIRERCEKELNPEMEREQLFTLIEEGIAEVTGNRESMLGIGFGDPGIVDIPGGRSLISVNLPHWKGAEISKRLGKSFDLPVLVNRSVSFKCLAEARFGAAAGIDNVLYIDLGVGIGMGVYSGGRLYSGDQGRGCELGHMVVSEGGPLCRCGARGCLEAVAGGEALVSLAREALENGVDSRLKDVKTLDTPSIIGEAEKKDRLASTLVESAVGVLGRAVGNVCNLFNPERVVLGGGMAASDSYVETLSERIRATSLPLIAEQMTIVKSAMIADGPLLGAAEWVVENHLR